MQLIFVIWTTLFICLSLFFHKMECNFFKTGAKIGVDVKNVRNCETAKDTPVKLYLSFNKYNRTHFGLDINATISEPFDSSYSMDTEIWKWGDGGWKKNYFIVKRNDACSTFYLYLGPAWVAMINACHVKQGCPIQKGFYYTKNHYVDLSHVPILLQPGRLYSVVRTMKNNKITTCTELEYEAYEIYS